MPLNHIPHPHQTILGNPPIAGQWSKYETQTEDLWPCFIDEVGERSPDGNYYNVTVHRLIDGEPSDGEWLYSVEMGRVLYVPKGPPWP